MKMNISPKTKIVSLILLLVLLSAQVFALTTVNIEVEPFFSEDEKIFFNYTFLSDKDEYLTYTPSVECPLAPIPLLGIRNIQLKENIPFQEEYVYMDKVAENIEPQICKARLAIIEPFEIIKEKEFEIATKPSFEFSLFLCKDKTCIKKSKIFIQNEKIYFNYNSAIPDPEITSILTLPDKTSFQINIPTSIQAKQIGTYDLNVTVSKEGYKILKRKIQFGTIANEANIGGELKPEVKKVNYLIIIVMGIVLLLILVLGGFGIYYFKTSKKRSETPIKTYIQKYLQEGYSYDKIKKTLGQFGWKEDFVDKCYEEMLKKK